MKVIFNNSTLLFGVSKPDIVITDFNTESDILKLLNYGWSYTGICSVNASQSYIKVSEGDELVLDAGQNSGQYFLCKSNPSTWPVANLTDDTYVVKNGYAYGFSVNAGTSETITIPAGVEYIMVFNTTKPATYVFDSITIKV